MLIIICVSVFKLGLSSYLRELKAVAGNEHDRIVLNFYKAAVKNSSLVVHTHREGHLREHLFHDRLRENEASVTRKVRNCGEFLTLERAHLMRGFSANDTSAKFIVNGKGYLITVHNLYCLIEFLCVEDISAFLNDLSFNSSSYSLFKVVGRKNANIGSFSLDKYSVDRGKGGFTRYGAHKGSCCSANCQTIKNDLHFRFLSFASRAI